LQGQGGDADEQNSLHSDVNDDISDVNNNSDENDEEDDTIMKEEDPEPVKSSTAISEEDDKPISSPIQLGGPNGSNGIPAYALLVGMIIDPDQADSNNDSENEIISIPITRLPTTLGKEHNTKDPSFVGLKENSSSSNNDTTLESSNAPKLSQSMCCIFYRDSHGGKLGLYKKGRKKEVNDGSTVDENSTSDPLDGMIYKPCDNPQNGSDDQSTSPDDVLRPPDMDAKAPLPTSGFFAIECTGRKIIVGGQAMRKGQVAMLTDGIPIKIATHCFYFLLPKKNSIQPQPSIMVKVATASNTSQIKPDKVLSSIAEKKDILNTSLHDDYTLSSPIAPPPPSKKPRKSEEFQSSFDDKSDALLLELLSQKVTETTWDHEGQKLGSTLATRVCRAAAKHSFIQDIVAKEGGVTQREIIDWMNDHPDSIYKDYESMMLAKIVEKSFMMSMGKAILRAGYTKNEFLSGRAFRWNLPDDIVESSLREGEEDSVKKEEEGNMSMSSPSPLKDHLEENHSPAENANEDDDTENGSISNDDAQSQHDDGDDGDDNGGNSDMSDEQSEDEVLHSIPSP